MTFPDPRVGLVLQEHLSICACAGQCTIHALVQPSLTILGLQVPSCPGFKTNKKGIDRGHADSLDSITAFEILDRAEPNGLNVHYEYGVNPRRLELVFHLLLLLSNGSY